MPLLGRASKRHGAVLGSKKTEPWAGGRRAHSRGFAREDRTPDQHHAYAVA